MFVKVFNHGTQRSDVYLRSPSFMFLFYFALLVFSFKVNTEHYRDEGLGDSHVVCDLLLVLFSADRVIAVPRFHSELMEHHSICSQTQLNLEISH